MHEADDAEHEAQAWIEAVTERRLKGDTLHEALRSGVVLCNLLNTLKPGAVKPPSTKKMPFTQMENIAAYVAACKSLGMPEFELFTTADLYESTNMKAVVRNIHSLGRLSQSFYNGPVLGAKLATANRRDFTEAQLNAGRHVVGGFGLGSHASAQADAKAKLGLAAAPPASPAQPEPEPEPEHAPARPAGGLFSGWLRAPAAAVERPTPPAVTAVELARRTSSALSVEQSSPREDSPLASQPSDPYAEAGAWIAAVLGEPLDGDSLHGVLKSGVVLCNLVNALQPGCCPPPSNRPLPFIQMENTGHYLQAAANEFNIPGFQSFMTVDLYENKNMDAVVRNIHALGSVCRERGLSEATLGAKLATANRRDFTEAQLNAGRHVVGGFGLGSHASAQADAKAKLGLAAAAPDAESPPAAATDAAGDDPCALLAQLGALLFGRTDRWRQEHDGRASASSEAATDGEEQGAAASEPARSTADRIESGSLTPTPTSPRRPMGDLRRAFNTVEDPRIHLPGFEKPHKPTPRTFRPWVKQGPSLVSELPATLGGGSASDTRSGNRARLTKEALDAKMEEAKRVAAATAEAQLAKALASPRGEGAPGSACLRRGASSAECVEAIAAARASARAFMSTRHSSRASDSEDDEDVPAECGGDACSGLGRLDAPHEKEDEDADFTEADLRAVRDCIFLLRNKPSDETVYGVLAEIGRRSPTWRSVFMLLDGLGALSKPLQRCAMGGEAGREGSPSARDLQLMGEIVHEVRSLMGELGMEILTASRAELARLREEYGVGRMEGEPTAGPELEMLTALALCIEPLRRRPGATAQLGAGPLPLLLAVAYHSAAGRAATLKVFAQAASMRGEAGRLSALVATCDAAHISAPPRQGPANEHYRARLRVAASALALLNVLISSPELLDDRVALREECADLGLSSHLDGIARAVAGHDKGSEPAAGEEQGEQIAALRTQLDLYAAELSADVELLRAPLDEYKSACVLLTTSISASKQVKENCRALEALLDGKRVGYTVVDGALPARARARNAMWAASGKAIGSSVLKKDYPQVFVDNRYIGGYAEVAHLMESDTVMTTKVQRMAAAVADGQAGFEETFRRFVGKPKVGERIVWE